jgi:hypothetical protein
MQCSNTNAWDLVKIAVDLIPDDFQDILYEDASRYHAEIRRILLDHGDGLITPHHFKNE